MVTLNLSNDLPNVAELTFSPIQRESEREEIRYRMWLFQSNKFASFYGPKSFVMWAHHCPLSVELKASSIIAGLCWET